ncbi:MAG: hypothetical protein Q8J64_02025 [Thermodesulfovibrionales bacterium]|nr:hypothetical protein [Thermodesulfovibrionales bacterium]
MQDKRPEGGQSILLDKILTQKNLTHATAALFFAYAFFFALKPLADPDLWWHLKTGQQIVEQRSLPGHEDPFSYTTPQPLLDEQVRGLRSQWLSQSAFYLVYLIAGYKGLSVMRALFIVLPFLWIYIRFSRDDALPAPLLLILSFPPLIINLSLFYTFERPQAFSFIFALVAIMLLERLKKLNGAGPKITWPMALLPVVMLLWANLHGGYIVGIVIIGIYMAGEVAAILSHRLRLGIGGLPYPYPMRFFASSLTAVAASFLNPGGHKLLYGWLRSLPGQVIDPVARAQAGGVITEVLEYKSLWYFYEVFHYKWPLYIIGFMAAALLAVLMKYIHQRRVDLTEALLFCFAGFLGLYHARGVNFALIILSFIACGSVSALKGAKKILPAVIAAAVTVVMVADVLKTAPWELSPGPPHRWVDSSYPEDAVRFLETQGIEGPMFNYMGWGGYLIWRAYPRYKVFADGRAISGLVMSAYVEVLRTTRFWKEMLNKFDVNFILIPVMSKENGVISPIVMRMAEDKPDGWRLVYLYNNTTIFLRNNEKNRRVTDGFGIPYAELYMEVIDISDVMLTVMPGHPEFLLSKAIALQGIGRFSEAKQILIGLPRTPLSQSLLEKLKDY